MNQSVHFQIFVHPQSVERCGIKARKEHIHNNQKIHFTVLHSHGRCDQRRCYEKLREYERSDLEPETLQKAQGLLKELKDARQTVELMDACGKRVCSSEEHWGCPYGNEGMTDCAVLLEAAYEDTIEKLLALKETLEG